MKFFGTTMLAVFLIVMLFVTSSSFADFSMMGMLTRTGTKIPELGYWEIADGPDDENYPSLHYDIYRNDVNIPNNDFDMSIPYDYFVFLGQLSDNYIQDDGYGLIYYKKDEFTLQNSQKFHQVDDPLWDDTYYVHTSWDDEDQDIYEAGYNAIGDVNNEAVIVLGHARNGSSGFGNHPFWFDYEGRTYTLEHNGSVPGEQGNPNDVEGYMLQQLNNWGANGWFDEYHPNWDTTPPYNDNLIDSEILFNYIMMYVTDNNGDVIGGIVQALRDADIQNHLSNPFGDVINFILSDGEALYVFKNAPNNDSHKLFYINNEIDDFVGVKTCTHYNDDFVTINQHELIYIPRDESKCHLPMENGVVTFENIFTNNLGDAFVYGDIDGTESWPHNIPAYHSGRYYVIGDVDVEGTLNIGRTLGSYYGANVYFTGTHEFTVNSGGTVNLNKESSFNISNHSALNIFESGSEFNLMWGPNNNEGATITGCTGRVYDSYTGMIIQRGDRITVRDGGKFTTGSYSDYENAVPEDPVKIKKYDADSDMWEGIIYEGMPYHLNHLVFCDISGVFKVSIEGYARTLRLFKSNFYDATSVYVKDDAQLMVDGACEFYNNQSTPIKATGGSITMQNLYGVPVVDNNKIYYNEGLYGIDLYSSPSNWSLIKDTKIYENEGHGIHANRHDAILMNNQITNNEGKGVVCYTAGSLLDLNGNDFIVNDSREFYGRTQAFQWLADGGNYFLDTNPNDYLLYVLDWVPGDPLIDVYGNTFNYADSTDLVYPDSAFNFIDPNGIGPRAMFDSGMESMDNEDYTTAETTFHQLISDYPLSNEALGAVQCLYWIENYTDKDFPGLRQYLNSISADPETKLYDVIEKIKTISYIDEKEYITAIQRLEEVISDSTNPEDERIYAMIDEGYCYMKLSEGNRSGGLPVECTIQTATEHSFHQKADELHEQLSFNKGLKQIEHPLTKKVPEKSPFKLQNYPNPFNPRTTILFKIPAKAPYNRHVRLNIYNMVGELVRTLIDEERTVGHHAVMWRGKDNTGKKVGSGMYIYRLDVNGKTETDKMLLLK